MSARDVRADLVGAWSRELARQGVADAESLALKLAVMAEAHGVQLARRVPQHEDPAADWSNPAIPVAPSAEYRQARAALRPISDEEAARNRRHLAAALRTDTRHPAGR